jgi:hypothetical protein
MYIYERKKGSEKRSSNFADDVQFSENTLLATTQEQCVRVFLSDFASATIGQRIGALL